MNDEEKRLDKSLREWGREQIIKAIWIWQIDVNSRCAWLANTGKKRQAKIEGNLSLALLEGLNPNLVKYLYDDGEGSK